jgi:peptide/nickel transport system substrate-binding protein
VSFNLIWGYRFGEDKFKKGVVVEMKKRTLICAVLFLLTFACFGAWGATADDIKDTIKIALAYDISSLDPQVGREMRACIISQQIFDTLVEWDHEKGIGSKIVPALATEWKYLSDTEVEFKIRQGVKFHNGEILTADDVVYSLQRTMKSPQVGYYATAFNSVAKIDDYTIVIKTNEAYAPLLSGLTTTPFSIVCKTVAEADEGGFAQHPVGTGRYKYVSYVRGEGARLEAFADCWRGAPRTKILDMRIVPENSQRTILLETGDVDIAYEILPNDVKKIESNSNLKIASIEGAKCYLINFNNASDGPVSKKLVRRAIELCVDRELLVDAVLYGMGYPAYIDVGPNNIAYQPVEKRFQDFETAKKLLAEAGYPNGGFKLNMWLDTNNVWLQYAQVIQSELDKVGIEVNIEVMESSALLARQAKDLKNFDMSVRFMNSLTGDARFTIYNLLYSKSSSNNARWNNPRADELILKGRAIIDPEGSKEIYRELYDLICDERPTLPLYYDKILVGLNRKVEGFIPRSDGIHIYADVICHK